MQIWAESGKSALPICNYSQILYQFLTFTQNLKRSRELFFFLVDEMADITFSRSLAILMAALMASLQEILKLSDEQLTAFTSDFEARLPEYLCNALHPEIAMA